MRTNYNNDLTIQNLNEEVLLYGWCNKVRKLGGLIFIDLRDVSGIVQIVVKPDNAYFDIAETITNESTLEIKGKVVKRENPNPNIKTGEIEIEASEIKLLSKAQPLPIDKNSNDEMRLKYRYLDLRRPDIQKTFILKSRVLQIVRNYLEANRFIDCETPILCKSTPEGARDYLVPSRIFKGEFYALPQSPQVLKQLLMVAGFDRYYQIAKCFRDEDLRADRQPEFSQIDLETSFLNQNEIQTILEGMFKTIWKEVLNIDLVTPFRRMKWDEAIRDYGSDKPDTRFDLKLEHFDTFKNVDSPLFNEKFVVGIRVNDSNNLITRKKIDEFTEYIKKHGGDNLLFLRNQNDTVTGSILKLLDEETVKSLDIKPGEILFLTSNTKYVKACESMGSLRIYVARFLNLIDESMYDFKWVEEFPLFERNEEGDISSTHHPFTRPLDEHIEFLTTDPLKVYSYAYDLVACGYEVGGGSLRIYDLDVQEKVFNVLNISEEKQKEKFGYLLDAMRFGCPPHGGCAFGVERLIMILIHSENIRDVVLFPKTTSAQDLMLDCPNEVDSAQLTELGIDVIKK